MRFVIQLPGPVIMGILLCVLGARAAAQGEPDLERRIQQLREYEERRFVVPENQPISERLNLDYGGSLTPTVYVIDDEFGDPHTLRRWEGWLHLQAELDGAHRFFGQLRLRYDDWNQGDSFDGRGDEFDEPIANEYWYQFDLRGAIRARTGDRTPYNVDLKVGKQFVQWGEGLTINNLVLATTLDLEWEDVGLTGLYGWTSPRDTIDFDTSRPDFDRDTQRLVAGLRLEYRGSAVHRPYFYYLAQQDHNRDDFAVITDPNGNAFGTAFQYDSSYLAAGSRGSLGAHMTYRFEGVYEFGRGLTSPSDPRGNPIPQHSESVRALAGNTAVTYLVKDPLESRLDAGVTVGSGDRDRLDSANTLGGNQPGTSDEAFNSLGFLYTGLALAPEVSNLVILHLGGSLLPLKLESPTFAGLRCGLDGYVFNKVDPEAATSFDSLDRTFVGGEVDFSMDWDILSDLAVNLRYGVFFAGNALPPGQDEPRQTFLMGLTYAF